MTRETLKCPSCGLNQFVNAAETCKRCKRTLRPASEPVEAVATAPAKWTHYSSEQGDALTAELAKALKSMRIGGKFSQRQLAKRVSCPRTYISKIENGKAQPTVVSLMRIAGGLGVPIWQILKSAEEAMKGEAK